MKKRIELSLSLDRALVFLPLLTGFLQIFCLIYCGFFWKPYPMRVVDPDLSFACWLFCNALGHGNNPSVWLILASTGSIFSIIAGLLFFYRRNLTGISTALVGGMILLPLGLLSLGPVFLLWKKKRPF